VMTFSIFYLPFSLFFFLRSPETTNAHVISLSP
jgi:hypothetical protein